MWPKKKTIAAPSDTPGGTPRGTPLQRWRRRLLWGGAIAVVVLVVLRLILWVALPWILNKTALQYGLQARYERLSLSLLTGDAELWHLAIVPSDANTPLADIEYCRAEVSLLTLLTGRLVVPRLEVDGLDVTLTRAADGTFPQLGALLQVLRERQTAAPQPAARTAPVANAPREFDLTPPLRLDAMRFQNVQVRYRDESVTPAFETRLDLNVRLSDLRSDKRRTRFQMILSSPPVLDQFLIEGIGASQARELQADVRVTFQGLHPGAVKDYLAEIGLAPDAQDLAFSWEGSVGIQAHPVPEPNDVQGPPKLALAAHFESKNAALTVDDVKQFTLHRVVVDANVPPTGAVQVSRVQVGDGTLHAWRRANGALSVAGLQWRGGVRAPAAAPPERRTKAAPGVWSVDSVEVRDVRFLLHDEAVTPRTDLVLDVNGLTIASAGLPSGELGLIALVRAPGILDRFQAAGTVALSSTHSGTVLRVSATGIRPEALQPHLRRLGIESLYKSGTFACDVNAAFTQPPGEALRGSAFLTNIRLRDTDELFGLQTIGVQGVTIDPNSGATRIEQIEIAGQRLALGRDEKGHLTALGFRFLGNSAPAQAEQAATRPTPGGAAGTGRIEIGRVFWHDNALTFVDRTVTPAQTLSVADAGLELTNLALGGAGTPAALRGWLRSPGTIERVELNGSITPEPNAMSFDLGLRGEGLTLTEAAPYLQSAGFESTITRGTIGAKLNGRVGWAHGGLQCAATLRDVAVKDGEEELAGLNRVDVAQLDLTDAGVRVEHIAIEQPRLRLSREESGAISFMGLRTIPRGGAAKAGEPQSKKPEPALPLRLSRLDVNDARVEWSDRAVTPAVAQSVAADLALANFTVGVESPPATLDVALRAPGLVERATIAGQVQAGLSQQTVAVKVEAGGIRAATLLSYLPPGWKAALEPGQFRAQVTAEAAPHPAGGECVRVTLTDVDYRGTSAPEPLLRFDAAELAVERFDPNARLVALREVSLKGLEATVERRASGAISVMGLDMSAAAPAEGPTAAVQKVSRPSGPARAVPRLPLVSLERLSLQIRKLAFKDDAEPNAVPLVASDLEIRNAEAIKVLGDDPEACPPIQIGVRSRIQPLTDSAELNLELSPFTAQPQVTAQWDITRIRGAGLTAVRPTLAAALDANSLQNGRISGTAQLTLHLDRRHVTEFDFGKPFGVDLTLKAPMLSDADKQTVLAGLEELRVTIPKLDPARGSVQIKEIAVVKPQGAISKEADGWHVLGMVLKPSTGAKADANNVVAQASQTPGKPLEVRVDQVLINGIDFNFTDRTVEPPLCLPLKGLDVEVRGWATAGAEVKEPMRFNVVATAGEVALPGARGEVNEPSRSENRLLFQEMTASGRLTLYPQPEGWVKAGLSGLELVDFAGTAKQKGVTLRDGIFDASVDVRFHKDQTVSTDARLVFTDLSLTEPPEGFLAKLLVLPVSLDTALFILRDAGGSIRLPLSFQINEDGLSGGQMTQAAVGAAASLIGGAVAGSPYRVAGTIGNILGVEKEEATGAETYVVKYDAGVTTLSEEQIAELVKIRERLRREHDLTVTVRHQLGEGDIGKAGGLVNPSAAETQELLTRLRQERAELVRTRAELAGEARAVYAAGTRESAMLKTGRLQEVETRLGLIERALDDLLETLRPGAESAAKRRTRDACIAIGKARLETVGSYVRSAETSEESGRLTFVPPRFSEADAAGSSCITLTLSKTKAR